MTEDLYDSPDLAINYALEFLTPADPYDALQFLKDWQHGEYCEGFKQYVDSEVAE